MAALGISAEGLEFREYDRCIVVYGSEEAWPVFRDRLLYRAIQIARLFGRER
jgi:hypothetical protein